MRSSIQSIYQLSSYLGRAGCSVRVLTTDANGIESVLDVDKGREVELQPNVKVRYCKRILRHSVSPSLVSVLPNYIRWADIVHLRAVYSFPTFFTLLACKFLGKPLVWTPHGAFQEWPGAKRKRVKVVWEYLCLHFLPRRFIIHVASDQEARTALSRFPKANVVIIPHGIQIPSSVAQEKSNHSLRILYLGRLHPIKGVEQLLDACKVFNDRTSESWRLTIAGSGSPDYTRQLEERIASLGIERRVEMIGEVVGDAKLQVFRKADVMVAPSFTESFNLTVGEALAHGLPVIASTGTPWNRVEDLGCGLWVSNNPESLAAALERIMHMPRKQMGENGRAWMEMEFNWDHLTQQMLRCYRAAIN